jgi:hypothetical protein
MSKKVYGQATIKVNGRELDTINGATLDPGGVTRTTVTEGRLTGRYSEKSMGAKIECECQFGQGDKLSDFDFIGATVEFKTDTAQTYVIRDAYRAGDPPQLAEGKVKLVIEGMAAEELL